MAKIVENTLILLLCICLAMVFWVCMHIVTIAFMFMLDVLLHEPKVPQSTWLN